MSTNAVMDKKFDYKAMGNRIRTRRRELNITQEELAEKTGVSTSFIGHIERGEKKASVETLAALSEALDMDLDYIVLGTKRQKDSDTIIQEIRSILDRYK